MGHTHRRLRHTRSDRVNGAWFSFFLKKEEDWRRVFWSAGDIVPLLCSKNRHSSFSLSLSPVILVHHCRSCGLWTSLFSLFFFFFIFFLFWKKKYEQNSFWKTWNITALSRLLPSLILYLPLFCWNCKNYTHTHPHTQDVYVVGLPTISGGSGEETNEKGRGSSDLFRCFFAFVLLLFWLFFFSLSFQSQKKLCTLWFLHAWFSLKMSGVFFRHSFDVLLGWRAPTVARKEITIFPFF